MGQLWDDAVVPDHVVAWCVEENGGWAVVLAVDGEVESPASGDEDEDRAVVDAC